MQDNINLRVFGFVNNGMFQLICLETDVAVSAESLSEAKNKMRDALISYFNSFSKEEIENEEYKRKAPFRFRVAWTFRFAIMHTMLNLQYLFSANADYNPHSKNLRLA